MLTDDVVRALGSYVYVYIDPRDGLPFYIGEGQGDRFLHHLDEKPGSEEVVRIDDFRPPGVVSPK